MLFVIAAIVVSVFLIDTGLTLGLMRRDRLQRVWNGLMWVLWALGKVIKALWLARRPVFFVLRMIDSVVSVLYKYVVLFALIPLYWMLLWGGASSM